MGVETGTNDGDPSGLEDLGQLDRDVSEHVVVHGVFWVRCVQVESGALMGLAYPVVECKFRSTYQFRNPNHHLRLESLPRGGRCLGRGGRYRVMLRPVGNHPFVALMGYQYYSLPSRRVICTLCLLCRSSQRGRRELGPFPVMHLLGGRG
jgi:hypothetical protein